MFSEIRQKPECFSLLEIAASHPPHPLFEPKWNGRLTILGWDFGLLVAYADGVTWGRDFGLQVAHADGLGFWAHVGRILGGIWGCRLLTLMDSGFGWDLSRTLRLLIFQVGFGLQVARSDGAGRCWVEVWGCGFLGWTWVLLGGIWG